MKDQNPILKSRLILEIYICYIKFALINNDVSNNNRSITLPKKSIPVDYRLNLAKNILPTVIPCKI